MPAPQISSTLRLLPLGPVRDETPRIISPPAQRGHLIGPGHLQKAKAPDNSHPHDATGCRSLLTEALLKQSARSESLSHLPAGRRRRVAAQGALRAVEKFSLKQKTVIQITYGVSDARYLLNRPEGLAVRSHQGEQS